MEWNMTLMWLIAAVLMAVLEAVTVQLVSIWFAVGALGACITSIFTDSILIQVIVFIVLSAAALAVTRPLVRHFKERDKERTNSDKYIGMSGVVIAEIDNEKAVGQVRVGSSVWSAKSSDGSVLPKDAKVKVTDLKGVKLIVMPESE